MREFARTVDPFEVVLSELRVIPIVQGDEDYGILWLDVEDTSHLRTLHERLNVELEKRFGGTAAPYDGPNYSFHLTITLGGRSSAVYRAYLDALPRPRVERRFAARELAMFVYDEPLGPAGEYLCYKILPLGS